MSWSAIAPILGAGISAATSIFGGSQTQQAQAQANAIADANARKNRQLQKEFAQNGIRWRVADAQAAGIHPLYALGAQTQSFSPVSVGYTPETGMAEGFARAGQDVSRALHATRTQGERETAVTQAVQDLRLQNMSLQNDLLASQIAKLRASTNPPIPEGAPVALPEGKQDDRTPLVAFGRKLYQNPGFSDGQTFEDRWGEWGGGAAGLAVLAADLIRSGHIGLSGLRRTPYGSREWWHTR